MATTDDDIDKLGFLVVVLLIECKYIGWLTICNCLACTALKKLVQPASLDCSSGNSGQNWYSQQYNHYIVIRQTQCQYGISLTLNPCLFVYLNFLRVSFLFGNRYLGDGDTDRLQSLHDGRPRAVSQTILNQFWQRYLQGSLNAGSRNVLGWTILDLSDTDFLAI